MGGFPKSHHGQNHVVWLQGLAGAQPHSEASLGALDPTGQVLSAPAAPGGFHGRWGAWPAPFPAPQRPQASPTPTITP